MSKEDYGRKINMLPVTRTQQQLDKAIAALTPKHFIPPSAALTDAEVRVLDKIKALSKLRYSTQPASRAKADVEDIEEMMAARWRACVEQHKPRVYASTPDWRDPRQDDEALFGMRLFEQPKARYWAFATMAKRRAFLAKHPAAQRCPNPLPSEPLA